MLAGLTIPAFVPAVAATNSHAAQVSLPATSAANGPTLYVTLKTPSGNVTYNCGPLTFTAIPPGPHPYTNTTKVPVINMTTFIATSCQKVSG